MSPRRPHAPRCTACSGAGRHLTVTERPGTRRVEWQTCTTCDGSGHTPATLAGVGDAA